MSLRDIKRRIKSVKLTKKITKAIQMVAASKVRIAQERALATVAYRDELLRMMSTVGLHKVTLPGMIKTGKVLYIYFSSDRGLCGAYNSALLRFFLRNEVQQNNAYMITIGKKGFASVKSMGFKVLASFVGISDKPKITDIFPVAQAIKDAVKTHAIAKVCFVYQQFVNVATQKPEILDVLPMTFEATATYYEDEEFEPSKEKVIKHFDHHYLTMLLYQVLLNAAASEHSARMLAMEQASSNASDLIFDLTQGFNKLRQSAITKELIEIVSGSQS